MGTSTRPYTEIQNDHYVCTIFTLYIEPEPEKEKRKSSREIANAPTLYTEWKNFLQHTVYTAQYRI